MNLSYKSYSLPRNTVVLHGFNTPSPEEFSLFLPVFGHKGFGFDSAVGVVASALKFGEWHQAASQLSLGTFNWRLREQPETWEGNSVEDPLNRWVHVSTKSSSNKTWMKRANLNVGAAGILELLVELSGEINIT